MRAENIPVSSPMLRTKVLEYIKWLGTLLIPYHSFHLGSQPSDAVSGEVNFASSEMTAPWKETALLTLLSRYELKDIYNADEFGVFYQCLPNKTLHLKGERCAGGKYGKIRLNEMAAGNTVGEKLPLFVIGKSRNPRSFKGVKSFPCRYRSQRKSWMTSDLFKGWVQEIDRQLYRQERKIALIIDNCPAHPQVENLKSVESIFLPPNTTCATQPMDQGVIRCLKAKYRSQVVQRMIKAVEKKTLLPKISILSAMIMLRSAWDQVSERTLSNCYKKAGMSKETKEIAMHDTDDPFKDLEVEGIMDKMEEDNAFRDLECCLETLKEKQPDAINSGPQLSLREQFQIATKKLGFLGRPKK